MGQLNDKPVTAKKRACTYLVTNQTEWGSILEADELLRCSRLQVI